MMIVLVVSSIHIHNIMTLVSGHWNRNVGVGRILYLGVNVNTCGHLYHKWNRMESELYVEFHNSVPIPHKASSTLYGVKA